VAEKHFGVAPYRRRLAESDVVPFLLDEIAHAPELWHQRAYLARVVNIDPERGATDEGIQPLSHFLDSGGPDALAATVEANGEGGLYPVVYSRRSGSVREHVLPGHPLHDFSGREYFSVLAAIAGELRSGLSSPEAAAAIPLQ
jgi:hypothetical protein